MHLHLCLVDVLLLQEGFASLGLALPAASRQHSCFRNTCERSLTAADLETPQRSWGKVRVQVSSNIKRSDHFHCRFTRLQEERLVGSRKTKSPFFFFFCANSHFQKTYLETYGNLRKQETTEPDILGATNKSSLKVNKAETCVDPLT